jgi:hypothetical protein
MSSAQRHEWRPDIYWPPAGERTVFVVFLAVKAGLPIIATLNHVMSVTGKIKAG